MISPSTSFTILGAGLVGRLLAVELARKGHAVSVYDAGGPQGEHAAAPVAAAMLAPLAESAITEPSVVRMGHYSLPRWQQLLSGLKEPIFFQQEGTLIVWHRQDAADALHLRRKLEVNQASVPELPAMEAVEGTRLASLEPALAGRFAQALYLPGEGQLDNRQLLSALVNAMEAHGVHLHWHSPRELSDCTKELSAPNHWVLDCRGLGARTSWSTLRGIRGEVIRIQAPEVTLQRPTRLVHPRYPIYVAPKENHVFVIGATEIESEDLSPASVRSALELLSAAYAVHPGFAEARILEMKTQCRPTLADNLPALRVPQDRVLQINGLYRHGFMIAPAMVDAALQWLNTGQSSLATQFDLAIQQE